MTGPTKRLIEHAYFSKAIKRSKSEEEKITFMLRIDGVPMSDEQTEKLLDILDRAALDANTVMGGE